jgi:heptaprenyl diphosphate synthase
MTDFWNDQTDIAQRLELVRDEMRAVLRAERFPMAEAVDSLIDANGKMLRPAMLLLAGDFGRKKKNLLPLAAAVELLHIATLIHDDVIDEAATRRGVPALHTTHGAKAAVLAGDWLFSRCFRLAADNSSPGNARLLAALVSAICSSEIHQDMDRFTWPESVRNYLRKIAGKTAMLFTLALRAGAQETGASLSTLRSLTRIGYDTGLAFQIMDDVLDFESSAGTMRKPVGKDVCEGLCTLPLILALHEDGTAIRPLLNSCKPDDETVKTLVEHVRGSGSLDAARAYATRYTDRALCELGRLPKGQARDNLEILLKKLLVRTF